MGLALHRHEEPKLIKWKMKEEGDTKRKKRCFPQALADPQALPMSVFVSPTT